MFADRLDADPQFARIRLLDLECPNCAQVFHSTGNRGAFNRRTGIFKCPDCQFTFSIGVLIYPATRGPVPQHAPADWVPTPRQALALRQGGGFYMKIARPTQGADRNVVVRESCRCLLEGTRRVVHPQCAIHGASPLEGAGNRPKRRRKLLSKHLPEGVPGELDQLPWDRKS